MHSKRSGSKEMNSLIFTIVINQIQKRVLIDVGQLFLKAERR